MLTIEMLISVMGLILTAYGVGYMVGSNVKNNRP